MKQFAVLGLGSFGSSLARNLFELGNDVYAVDKNEELINEIADKVTYAVQADITDIHALRAIGIQNVDVAIVALSSDLNASFSGVINANELGIKIIYAKAQNDAQSKVLYKLGVDKVILPEKEMGRKLAHNLTHSSLMDLIDLDPTHTLMEIETMPSWVGHSLIELDLRARLNINVVVIKRNEDVIVNPPADELLQIGDKLIVIGDISELNKLLKKAKNANL